MKRFFLLLIIIGVFIGVFLTLRNSFLSQEASQNNEIEIEQEIYRDELNLPLIEVDTLNPLLTKNKQVSDVLKLIYEPLFDFDENNKVIPTLVSEWNEKDDLTWIFKLNKSAIWHNGKSFTASDVIFTYNAILNSENSVYKENIENINSIEQLENETIQINLIEKDKNLIYKLCFPILPKHYFEHDLNNELKNEQPVGTGPYKYEATLSDGKIIKLISNNSWWNKENIKLNTIYLYKYSTYGEAIKAFKSVEIDVISTTMSSWQKKFGAIGINDYKYESSEFETIIANNQDTVLSESSVRKMLLTGINCENIIESIYNGNGKVSNYPLQSNSYLNKLKETKNYDIEKAKQILFNAGWDNSSGTWIKQINNKKYYLNFDLLVNSDNEQHIKIAELIKENLKEIGITIKVIKANTKEYNKRIEKGNFELVLATINLDMDTDIIELLDSQSTKNFAKYSSIEIDNIIAQINMDNLEEKILQIQEIYKNDSPYIGMYYKCNNLLTNKSVKGNINPTSWNIYHDIISWCK
ncbi:MAG: peptide ABC transporter substrate-binding protein [Clostridia bacterium]|nr:peptide ABC transporter substrate-binding protein [Clostridia bacterium]